MNTPTSGRQDAADEALDRLVRAEMVLSGVRPMDRPMKKPPTS